MPEFPAWAPRAALIGVSGVVIGAGLTAAWLRHHPILPEPNCSQVEPGGGTVAGVRYLEQMRGGAQPEDEVPMVIVFHSLGARPEGHIGMFKGLGPSRVIAPEGEWGNKYRRWWPMPVKAAVRPENSAEAEAQWTRSARRMRRFIQEIIQCRPTAGTVVVTGSSQGGEMALLMASTLPELVDHSVAVSSYLLPPFWTRWMAPTTMIHGTGDGTVPYPWAVEYFQDMAEAGAPISFAAYESPGHAVTSEMSREWQRALNSAVAKA